MWQLSAILSSGTERPFCEWCEGAPLHRLNREGLYGVLLYCLGLFPWECEFCERGYLLKSRQVKPKRPSRTFS